MTDQKNEVTTETVNEKGNGTRKSGGLQRSRAREIAICGLFIALFAVSASIAIPLGPVPFTLQTMILILATLVLRPSEAAATVGGYLVLGAIGLPVFSGMRGGLGIIFGPTGGFLIGFFFAALIGSFVRTRINALKDDGESAPSLKAILAVDGLVGIVALLISYACGWAQYMAVAGVGPLASFLTVIVPFVALDLGKTVVAIMIARPVRKAIGRG